MELFTQEQIDDFWAWQSEPGDTKENELLNGYGGWPGMGRPVIDYNLDYNRERNQKVSYEVMKLNNMINHRKKYIKKLLNGDKINTKRTIDDYRSELKTLQIKYDELRQSYFKKERSK